MYGIITEFQAVYYLRAVYSVMVGMVCIFDI